MEFADFFWDAFLTVALFHYAFIILRGSNLFRKHKKAIAALAKWQMEHSTVSSDDPTRRKLLEEAFVTLIAAESIAIFFTPRERNIIFEFENWMRGELGFHKQAME